MSVELGRHLLADLSGCNPERLKYIPSVKQALILAAHACQATLLHEAFNQFEPVGVSGILLIAESHLSVHTWPEEGYAAIDIFTCSEDMDLHSALEVLKDALEAQDIWIAHVSRGTSPGMNLSTEHRNYKEK